MPSGWAKPAPLTVAIVFQLVASTTLTSLERMFVTQTSRPSGVKATYQGQVPTVTVRVRRGCARSARANTSSLPDSCALAARGLPPGGTANRTKAGAQAPPPLAPPPPPPPPPLGAGRF